MKRVGFVLKVKADRIEEYRKIHENVWPEMREKLTEHGWHNYSLFIGKDGTLFGYFETPESFESALQGMDAEAVNEKWQAMMSPFFEAPDGSHPDKNMLELQELFHLE